MIKPPNTTLITLVQSQTSVWKWNELLSRQQQCVFRPVASPPGDVVSQPRVSAVECLNPQVSFQQSSKQLPDQQRKNQVLSSY